MTSITLKFFTYIVALLQMISLVLSNPIGSETAELIRHKRWGKVAKVSHWPGGVIHYKIACTEYTEDEISGIKAALQEIMDNTCLKFIEINDDSNETNYINLSCDMDGSCKSKLGYVGGAQFMNLARVKTKNPLQACLSKRKIHHEFLHALGFKHEHTSFNRDDFIEIHKENMADGWDQYFEKDVENKFSSYGCAFDFNSVMMPPAFKHSKNGLPMIVPKITAYTTGTIGIAEGISQCDITRINNMYCTDKNTIKNN